MTAAALSALAAADAASAFAFLVAATDSLADVMAADALAAFSAALAALAAFCADLNADVMMESE